MPRSRLLPVFVAAALAAPASAAAPHDELLRLAPADAALVLVVQNARDHVRTVAASPFAEWLPRSALGKQLFAAIDPKGLRESAAPVFAAVGITPDELLDDIFGDAAAFAYSPATADRPAGERAVILVRPRKPELLAKLIERLNAGQTGGGEIKAVVRRLHNGGEYFERQKPAGGADFYCFRGGVFAFSGTEPDIRAVIDRDTAAPPVADKPPELAAKLAKLGVADAFVVGLVNPRPLDAEVRAKAAAAKPAEKPFLDRFQEAWLALDAAAVYLAPGTDLEVGVSLQFQPGKLPPGAKEWLTGPRSRPEVWGAVPANALFAAAGRFKAADLIDALGGDGAANPLRAAVGQFLGPVVGKGKLPHVLDALGPNWAVWVEPPAGDAFVPVLVAAVEIEAAGPKGKDAARALTNAVGFGFNAARVAYNAGHADQIELEEAEDGDAVVTTLVNDKAFPPGFRPSYSFKGGYLVVATSPDAVRRFRRPAAGAAGSGPVPVARFNGTATLAYLQTHRDKLAKLLSAAGHGDEAELRKQLDQVAAVLEPVDRVEVQTRGDDGGIRLALRVTLVKPLKK